METETETRAGVNVGQCVQLREAQDPNRWRLGVAGQVLVLTTDQLQAITQLAADVAGITPAGAYVAPF